MDANFLWLALFVFIAYTTQAMTGFGSVIIAVTLGSHFYPLDVLLPVLVPLDILVNSYIVARYRKAVDRKILFRSIVPLMSVGLLAGILIFQFVQGPLLKQAFGLLITVLCFRELYRLQWSSEVTRTLSRVKYTVSVLSAGIVQGVFASGGPLIVYAVSKFNLPKANFRSTLSSLWLLTNTILTVSYVLTGRLTAESLKFIALLVPLIGIGMVVGEKLHDHINEHRFRVIVYLILVVAGISIVVG